MSGDESGNKGVWTVSTRGDNIYEEDELIVLNVFAAAKAKKLQESSLICALCNKILPLLTTYIPCIAKIV